MSSGSAPTCVVCYRLWHTTNRHQRPGYVNMEQEGARGAPMLRLYVRGSGVGGGSRAMVPVGYICEKGHTVLDNPPEEDNHILTPTWPPDVICRVTGELVKLNRETAL